MKQNGGVLVFCFVCYVVILLFKFSCDECSVQIENLLKENTRCPRQLSLYMSYKQLRGLDGRGRF